MPTWKAIGREPLVHFVAIGIVLFAIDAMRSSSTREVPAPAQPVAPAVAPPVVAPSVTPQRVPIVVDAELMTTLTAQAERRYGRPPTAAELASETERWIDEEMLFREAIARGLERDDPVIHQRIASRMSYVLEQAAIVPEPTEAELRAWFDANRDRWTVPPRLDFTHVFIAGTDAAAAARVDELAAALAAGSAPERLGDRFSGGRRYRGRKIADLALAFGDEFVDGLASQAVGPWVRRRSRYGQHLVRVDHADAGKPADFDSARLDARKAWREARLATEIEGAVRRLRAGWEIVRP